MAYMESFFSLFLTNYCTNMLFVSKRQRHHRIVFETYKHKMLNRLRVRDGNFEVHYISELFYPGEVVVDSLFAQFSTVSQNVLKKATLSVTQQIIFLVCHKLLLQHFIWNMKRYNEYQVASGINHDENIHDENVLWRYFIVGMFLSK